MSKMSNGGYSIYTMLQLLSNRKRVEILRHLYTKPDKLSGISVVSLGLSPQETRRYLLYLEEARLIRRVNNVYKLTLLGEALLSFFELFESYVNFIIPLSDRNALIPCLNPQKPISCNYCKSVVREGGLLDSGDGAIAPRHMFLDACPLLLSYSTDTMVVEGLFNVVYHITRVIKNARSYLKIALKGAELYPIEYPDNLKVYILTDGTTENSHPYIFSERTSFIFDVCKYEGCLPFNAIISEKELLIVPLGEDGRPVGDIAIISTNDMVRRCYEDLFDRCYKNARKIDER